jgi:hypothetical protein
VANRGYVATTAGEEVEIRSTGAGIEIIDRALDTWLVRVEPGTAGLQAAESPAVMVGRATMRGLTDAMPTLGGGGRVSWWR